MIPILAASIAVGTRVRLSNAPDVLDTRVLGQIIRGAGGLFQFENGRLSVDFTHLRAPTISTELSASVHGTIYLLPALLARFGAVELFRPGGCALGDPDRNGSRPVHHVLDVLRRFGASTSEKDGVIEASARTLHAAHIDIRNYSSSSTEVCGPLVSGATKAAILAGLACEGESEIRNPHNKPDVADLDRFLRQAGAQVSSSPEAIRVRGGVLQECTYDLIPDCTELVTLVAASAYLGCRVFLEFAHDPLVEQTLAAELIAFREIGVGLDFRRDGVLVTPSERYCSVDVEATSRGLSTDSQPFFAVLLLRGRQRARISDRVWTHRFGYASALKQMGAHIEFGRGEIHVCPSELEAGKHVTASDTRAAAALLLAALGIDGTTTISGLEHLDRGYENLPGKLRAAGACIDIATTDEA